MSKQKLPKIDWLRAIVLERQKTCGFDMKDLASLTGLEYGYIRKLFQRSPSEWPGETKKKIFRALEIDVASLPEAVQLQIAQY